MINIREEVIKERCGIHSIKLNQRLNLKNKLDRLADEKIFEDHKMSYYVRTESDVIILNIYKTSKGIKKND